MADRLFYQRQWANKSKRPDKHAPSPLELGGMRRRLEEAVAYAMLDLDRLIMPVGITSPLQAGIAAFQQAIEHVQIQQSESADRSDI